MESAPLARAASKLANAPRSTVYHPIMRFPDDLHRAFESDGRDDPELEAELDDDFPLGDGTAEMEATVWCPYCGEPVEIALDPGSGTVQDYVEDCAVCCQPWRVSVVYYQDGSAGVSLTALDD
jgi:hypothetical protein